MTDRTWAVYAAARRPRNDTTEPGSDAAERFAEAALAVSGATGVSADRWDIAFDVLADDPVGAAAAAHDTVSRVCVEAGMPTWPVVRLEVMHIAEQTDDIERPLYEHLVGTTEVADLLGVSRQRAHALAREHPGFPVPLVRLSSGPIWDRHAVERFAERWDRRPGRRAGGGISRVS